jgi:hypothetical protein
MIMNMRSILILLLLPILTTLAGRDNYLPEDKDENAPPQAPSPSSPSSPSSTLSPSVSPSKTPTLSPSVSPSVSPSKTPSVSPSKTPSLSPILTNPSTSSSTETPPSNYQDQSCQIDADGNYGDVSGTEQIIRFVYEIEAEEGFPSDLISNLEDALGAAIIRETDDECLVVRNRRRSLSESRYLQGRGSITGSSSLPADHMYPPIGSLLSYIQIYHYFLHF